MKFATNEITVFKNFNELETTKDNGYIKGYASVFGSVDEVGDTIDPCAFDAVLATKYMPAMYFNHDSWELPIGRWDSLEKDTKGLIISGQIDLSRKDGQEIYNAIKFGSVKGLSVGMRLLKKDIEETDNGRIIKNVKSLLEVSICAMPCERNAQITNVKSLLSDVKTVRDFEDCLRDLGLSKNEALLLCSKAKSIFGHGEHDEIEQKNLEIEQLVAQKLSNINKLF